MSQESKNPELINLPVVPLRGTAAFPHTIFRMEFRSEDSAFPAVNIALGDDADRRVLLLAQKDILEDEPLNDDFLMSASLQNRKGYPGDRGQPDGCFHLPRSCPRHGTLVGGHLF